MENVNGPYFRVLLKYKGFEGLLKNSRRPDFARCMDSRFQGTAIKEKKRGGVRWNDPIRGD
jgi:hypothetical protein